MNETTKKQDTNGNTHEKPPLPTRAGGKQGCPRVRDRFRLSRLRTPSVSWLGGVAPRGLPAPMNRGSGTRGISSALQSRGGDGFAPSSRHGVCGECGGAAASRMNGNATLLRVND